MCHSNVKMGSNRSFGLVFAAVFAVIALLPLVKGHPVRLWALPVSAVFLVLALFVPAALAPLNRLWFRIGLAIGKVMTPVAMGLLFVVAVVPTAVVLKLMRKDMMKLRFDPDAQTYWESRTTQPGSMKEQF